MSRMWFYGHEGGAKMRLIIFYGVVRGHYGVRISLRIPREYPHLYRLIEILLDLRLRKSVLLQVPVTVTPAPCLLHESFHCLLVDII